jgi:ubiquinone/menaquinone biosynthesis C-methylase UbiE
MPEETTSAAENTLPAELAANMAAYSSNAAVAEFSVYRLLPEEEYILPRYYRAGESLLDLACGVGRTTLLLHEMGMKVRGVDLSEVFIQTAKRRLPYLDLHVGSYDEIHEADTSWDHVAISFNGIDYAFPQAQREKALRECVRVLKPGGTLIFSSHNLKSLHWFSPYYRSQLKWKLRNCLKAFKEWDYVLEGNAYTFYSSRQYVTRQAEALGLELEEMRGFAKFKSAKLDHYFSPYILYVFRKPAANGQA